MKISECMRREVRMVEPKGTIRDAAALMAQIDVGALPVTDGDRLVGMITDRDIAIRGVGDGKGPDTRIADVMSPEVKYCYDDQPIEDVLKNMGDVQLRRLPVVNRDKRLVGIVSLADLANSGESSNAGEALSGITRQAKKHSH